MNIDIFNNREQDVTPVWFMRQAGRYHTHYQNLKKQYDFMTLCKNSELAAEVTMGPIEDFNFNAAILFSDLLFPLEQFNLGLSYESGPPTLETHLEGLNEYKNFHPLEDALSFYLFQARALEILKKRLPSDKTLLGFVGAPFTLYTYATEGGHKGNLTLSKQGLYDGRFSLFCEKLIPELLKNIYVQLEAGADAICLFDTAVGELCFKDFKNFSLPQLKMITKEVKKKFPNKKIIYYSKMTSMEYLHEIQDDNIDVLGIDWRVSLTQAMKELGNDYFIQGNVEPAWLHLSSEDLAKNLDEFKVELQSQNFNFKKWIAGLGHGVTIQTPEENVRLAVKRLQNFSC
jgi:uroporphyrinogen decarboxylase